MTDQEFEASGADAALEAAIAHHQSGDLAGAKAAYEAILEGEPEHAEAHRLLGLIAHQMGDAESAIEHLQRALTAQPENPTYHHNLAEVYRAVGEVDGAIAAYRRATAIHPEFFEALTNLGLLSLENDHIGEGIEALRRSVAVQPGNASAQANLGIALREVGAYDAALEAFAHAVALAPEQTAFRRNFIGLLEGGPFITVHDSIGRILENALLREALDHQSLSSSCLAVIKRLEAYQTLTAMAHGDDLEGMAAGIAGGLFDAFMSSVLVRGILSKTIVADVEFEHVLTALRRVLVQEGVAPLPVEATVARQPQFVAALALQAYNMQYAWSESSQEGAIAATLLRDIKVKLASGNAQDLSTDAGFWSLALVSATLRPLSDIEGSENFLSTDIAGLPAFVSAVVRQQVAEPLMESEMEAAVEAVTAIEDATSLEVQAQNENRPSPRWFSIAPKQAGTLGDTLRAQAPWSRPPVFAEGEINAFVAGCGTGKHAIDVATQYPMSNVTGLDLSRTSLAYAWRMALELQLTNVRFVQGDIAALQGHAERYHLIECVGVLHSMADPVAGWRNLVGLLEPHGIMKIGLYSAAARADVTAAREVIAEAGVAKKAQQDDIFGADSIRRARQVILNLEPGHPARGVIAKRDFFSLSGCRDMLFPAREQTYSIPAIAADLGQLGLDFLGFHISDPAIVERYLEMHPEAEDLADLGNWQKVEEAHADTFAGMYQFWCQKRD